jgi:hypothetical protein
MNRFLGTTAIAALLAFGPAALAQETTAPEAAAPGTAAPAGGEGFVQAHREGDVFASDLIGMDIYASADEVDATQPATEDMRAGWEDIGEVNDLLVSAEGQVEAVLVDVGGFLGMGEHTIAVQMDSVNLMTDDSGGRFAAIMATRESLELAPEFERPDTMAPAGDTMGAAPGAMTDTTAADTTAPADTMAADDTAMEPAAEGEMAAAPGMAGDFTPPEGYGPLALEDLTADRLDLRAGARPEQRPGDAGGRGCGRIPRHGGAHGGAPLRAVERRAQRGDRRGSRLQQRHQGRAGADARARGLSYAASNPGKGRASGRGPLRHAGTGSASEARSRREIRV